MLTQPHQVGVTRILKSSEAGQNVAFSPSFLPYPSYPWVTNSERCLLWAQYQNF